jgi:UDP-3-O-[3-hydroxymyristoyl] glucosamine N-acyltransferase
MTRAAVPLTAAAIAELVGGRLDGDGSAVASEVGPLDRAGADSLSFLIGSRYLDDFARSAAGVVLVPEGAALPAAGPRNRIAVPDPQRALARVLSALFPAEQPAPGIDPTARIGRGCEIGEAVAIGPNVVLHDGVRLGDRVFLASGVHLGYGVEIGPDSSLDSHVVCYPGTRLGARVVVKAGAVIGGTGFGYLSDRTGHHLIPHVGGCLIGDDVHVGANNTIDRGSVGDTVIGAGTRLDNQVHIGHNARVGERCLFMGGVVVAGSARIGNDVVLAGHSAIGGHFRVGDRARVGAKSGVISEVPAGTDVSGFPARPHREFLRAQAALFRLAPLIDELEELVRRRPADHA